MRFQCTDGGALDACMHPIPQPWRFRLGYTRIFACVTHTPQKCRITPAACTRIRDDAALQAHDLLQKFAA